MCLGQARSHYALADAAAQSSSIFLTAGLSYSFAFHSVNLLLPVVSNFGAIMTSNDRMYGTNMRSIYLHSSPIRYGVSALRRCSSMTPLMRSTSLV